MLDCISGGRLVAGFPVGTPMDTNFCYGQIPALTRDKYREAHELIMKAWSEPEPFAFNGKYTQLRYVNIWPRPIQQPHPPIYIPGGGSIETWDFCLDYDYNYSYLSFGGYLAGKKLLDGYWDRVAERDKDDSPYRAAFAQIIAVADTDAEAEKLYAEHILYFFNRCLHVYPGFSDPAGYRTISTIKAGVLDQFRAEMREKWTRLTWKDLVDGGFVIAGGPDTVRDRMEDMIRSLRLGHVFCLMHNGNQPDWKTRYSTQLFAEKVMPQPPQHVARVRGRRPLVDPSARGAGARRRDVPRRPPSRGTSRMTDVAARALDRTTITTRRGITCDVLVGAPASGDAAASVVSFHGATGPLGGEPMLAELADRFAVYAPVWPGYGEQGGEETLDDMQDFAMHGADVVEALGLTRPHLIGHSMGGMVVAEMAAAAPTAYDRVALIAPLGLWLDELPVTDIYSLLPFEFPPLLFHDAAAGTALMAGGLDFNDTEAIKTFLIANSRRLGTAGKVLFPIPDRKLAKRLYRITNPTLLVWGDDDRYLPRAYADAWQRAVEGADLEIIPDAGHMAPYERPADVAGVIARFFGV